MQKMPRFFLPPTVFSTPNIPHTINFLSREKKTKSSVKSKVLMPGTDAMLWKTRKKTKRRGVHFGGIPLIFSNVKEVLPWRQSTRVEIEKGKPSAWSDWCNIMKNGRQSWKCPFWIYVHAYAKLVIVTETWFQTKPLSTVIGRMRAY